MKKGTYNVSCLFTAYVGHGDVYSPEGVRTLGLLWMLFGGKNPPKYSANFGIGNQQLNCIKSENKN